MRLQTAGSRTLPAIEAVVERESGFPDLQNLLRSAIDVRPNQNLPLISKAYHFAELAHRNLRRKSGDPAISHAVAVCRILIDLGLDSATAAAGLLHDVVDETDVPLAQIESHFGAEIAGLVDGVSKIKDFSFQSPEAEQAENFRKMLLSMARDLRVVLIKLADRLHNMRTLKFMRPESQERMVYESRDIYAPLAHRLGMSRIRAELEDLSLKWLDPKAYRYIQEKINLTREEREACIEAVRKPLSEALENAGIQADMTGRSKNFSSIYKKMNGRERAFDEIYDLLALRVLVDTVPECYNVLGLVHTMYPPVTARFKDFIATPKSNMYQSLHTTIIGPSGMMLEVQIRTRKMHQTAEVGIAAHWLYKEGKRGPSEMDRHMAWLRSLLEWQRETTSPQEFMDELKVDLFPNEIFVFTPKGDLIQLPEGATPLDFAFAVHTDVGLRCIGSRVDDQMVSLSTPLRTGSTVEVITSPHQRPNRDWLDLVKSARARSRIRRWLREEEFSQSVRIGKDILDRELKRRRKRTAEEKLESAAAHFSLQDVEHLYASLGNGTLSLERVVHQIFPAARPIPRRQRPEIKKRGRKNPIVIHSLNHLMIQFARCCQPIYGDSVLGVITRGKGISVHRRDCVNISNLPEGRDRLVDVDWNSEEETAFTVQIRVNGEDRPNFLRDISEAISGEGVPVVEGELNTSSGQVGNRFTVEVRNVNQLHELRKKILSVPGVSSVQRINASYDNVL